MEFMYIIRVVPSGSCCPIDWLRIRYNILQGYCQPGFKQFFEVPQDIWLCWRSITAPDWTGKDPHASYCTWFDGTWLAVISGFSFASRLETRVPSYGVPKWNLMPIFSNIRNSFSNIRNSFSNIKKSFSNIRNWIFNIRKWNTHCKRWCIYIY